MPIDMAAVCEIIEKHGCQEASLIAILQDIQARLGYLPQKVLVQVSKSLDVPLHRIYGIATFYRAFSLEPRGRHYIQVCLGTACHVRGGARILDYLESRLGIKIGKTTEDLAYTLESVNCLGACAIGPVVVVDGKYHGQVKVNRIDSILKKYS